MEAVRPAVASGGRGRHARSFRSPGRISKPPYGALTDRVNRSRARWTVLLTLVKRLTSHLRIAEGTSREGQESEHSSPRPARRK